MKIYRHLIVLILTAWVGIVSAADPIVLTGSNGRTIAFAGVKSASPQGLTLLVSETSEEMLVAWNRFDIEALEQHPAIFKAYEAANLGKTTQLNLGVYEDMISMADFQRSLSKALARKHNFPIPRLSAFFVHKNDDQSFTSTSKSQDSSAAKRSKRFVRTYVNVLEEFFLINDPDLVEDTVTWDWGGGSVYRIVKEAYPRGASSAKLSGMHVLQFLANERNSSRNKAVQYINSQPRVIEPLINTLEKYRKIAETQLMADEAVKHRYAYLLNEVIEQLQRFSESITLDHGVGDDIESAIREMKLGQPGR